MTSDKFRQLALALPEAVEASHMNHPDFRVGGKIFATLMYPTREYGMVSLTPAQQARFVREHPDVFKPVKGGWGVRGATQVFLPKAKVGALREALEVAWTNRAPKRLVRKTRAE